MKTLSRSKTIQLAETLTGIPISNAIRARYEELLTTQIVNITQFGGALLEQQNLFDSFESTVAELPSPRRSGLVSLPKLQTIMSDLGYEYAGEHERHLIYMKAKNGEPDLPPGFRVYPPPTEPLMAIRLTRLKLSPTVYSTSLKTLKQKTLRKMR